MSKRKVVVPQEYKESPEDRNKRVTSGVRFRPSVMPDKSKYSRKTKHKGKDERHE